VSPRVCVLFGMCAFLAFGCSPDEDETNASELLIDYEHSSMMVNVEPSYPDLMAIVDGKLYVGLESSVAGAKVALREAALVGPDGLEALLAGARFEKEALSDQSTFTDFPLYGIEVTNGQLTQFCENPEQVELRVVVDRSDAPGSATATLPVTLTCREDRRRPDLSELVTSGNPSGFPCRILTPPTVQHYGYDASGTLLFMDEVEGEDGLREVWVRNQGRVSEHITLDKGVWTSIRIHTYDSSGRLVQTHTKTPLEARSRDFTWSANSISDGSSQIHLEGNTIRFSEGQNSVVLAFDVEPDLTDYMTLPRVEFVMKYRQTSWTMTRAGTTVQVTFEWDGDRVLREVMTIGDQAERTWVHQCE